MSGHRVIGQSLVAVACGCPVAGNVIPGTLCVAILTLGTADLTDVSIAFGFSINSIVDIGIGGGVWEVGLIRLALPIAFWVHGKIQSRRDDIF